MEYKSIPVMPESGATKEVCTLDEGEAILLLPEKISKESYNDLNYWISGILRKIERRLEQARADAEKDRRIDG